MPVLTAKGPVFYDRIRSVPWIEDLREEARKEAEQSIIRCHVCGVLDVSKTCPSCVGDYRADSYEPEKEDSECW